MNSLPSENGETPMATGSFTVNSLCENSTPGTHTPLRGCDQSEMKNTPSQPIPAPVVRMSPAQERALEQTAFVREALTIAGDIAKRRIAKEDAV